MIVNANICIRNQPKWKELQQMLPWCMHLQFLPHYCDKIIPIMSQSKILNVPKFGWIFFKQILFLSFDFVVKYDIFLTGFCEIHSFSLKVNYKFNKLIT